MSYSDFTIDMLKEQFAIELIEDVLLFPNPSVLPVPQRLAELLQSYLPLAITINTEKARSELIIAPILADLKLQYKDRLSLFSGIEFTIDKAKGLNGRCDYILSKTKEQLALNAPLLMMVEAKNENIVEGIPQCIAEMIAAQLFNTQKKIPISNIYGVVTTGSLWRFLKLTGQQASVDVIEYPIQQLDTILGILQDIINIS